MSLKTKNNCFLMHENGEDDLRGVFIVFAANPNAEAHGGYILQLNVLFSYSFCGFAALVILNETKKIHLNKLFYWVS